MPQPCIFCDNNSGSREHLWAKWIHERKDFGPLRIQRGRSEEQIIPNPEIKVKTVCGVCNNGWMSKLENENIPVIGSMMLDIATTLDEGQQRTLAAWSVKTAMMSDSIKGRNASNRFYKRQESFDLRQSMTIPPRTLIWIGRIDGMHLADVGTDFTLLVSDSKERVGMGSVVTIVVGHFVTQVVTVHVEKLNIEIQEIPCKMGNWSDLLIQIWPILIPVVHWPPKAFFTSGGPQGIAYLLDRWRIGDGVDKIRPA